MYYIKNKSLVAHKLIESSETLFIQKNNLKRFCDNLDLDMNHSQKLNFLSKLNGYKNYHEHIHEYNNKILYMSLLGKSISLQFSFETIEKFLHEIQLIKFHKNYLDLIKFACSTDILSDPRFKEILNKDSDFLEKIIFFNLRTFLIKLDKKILKITI